MKAIQLLINSQLPPDLRDYTRELDSRAIGALMADVARKYPDQYERISKSISDIGRKASYFQGETLTLSDNRPVIDKKGLLDKMDEEVAQARKMLPDDNQFEETRMSIWEKYNNLILKDTTREALNKNNNLAYSVVSGARGKPLQLKMMVSTPGLYTDAQDATIPLFVRKSFGEGLRPAEYLAGTYGARKSVLCLHEDTLVRLANNTAVPIKHINIGMKVLGSDKEGNTFPVTVTNVFNQGLKPVNKYNLKSFKTGLETSVLCTRDHKFLFIDADTNKPEIIKIDNFNNGFWHINGEYEIHEIEYQGELQCFDIEVDHPDHLFVLDNGLICSNSTKRATAKGGDLCLGKNTEVRMSDGTAKYIQDIVVGDEVLGCSVNGEARPVKVTATFNQGIQPVNKYNLKSFKTGLETSVLCTRDHKFLFLDADTNKPEITKIDSFNNGFWHINGEYEIHEIEYQGELQCFDIEVDHPDHLFVLSNGLITSNSKQMQQSSARLVVTENDCGAANGLDLDIDDKSLRGRVLARETNGIPAGTVIDKLTMANLRKGGAKHVVARSAMTCQAKEGLCAKCMGIDAEGNFPSKGDSVGITAAQAIGEPVCILATTLVRMADYSVKEIQHITPGEMVLGSDINGYLKPTKVVNVFHNGIRNGYRTKIKKGKGAKSEVIELISTKEHKVLSYQGGDAINAKPIIQPIETIGKNRHWAYLSKGIVEESGIEEPLADILGLLIGDGSYTGNGSMSGVVFSCYDKELEDYLKDRLEDIKMNLSHMSAGEFRLSMKDQYSQMEHVDGVLVRNIIKAVLIKENMWGQSSGTKLLPASIHSWNNESVAKLIGGLVATDGWVTGKHTVGFGSNSKKLLEDIKLLLELRFGIYSSNITGKQKKKKEGGFYATNYSLTVSDGPNILQFHKHIPVPGCKQKKLDAAVSKISSSAEELRGRYSVISQEAIGEIDTWDIEVDNDTHLFVLENSIIVSNTQNALNCISINTKVLMADYSEKCIQDIQPGELVMGADINGNIFPTKVSHTWDQGLQPVQRRSYKVGQTKQRLILESTAAHPVLSNRKTYGAVRGKNNLNTEKLVAGYPHKNIAAVLPVNNLSEGKEEPWAIFLGAYLGDGIRWNSQSEDSYSVTFSCADESEIEDLNSLLEPLNVKLHKCSRKYDWRLSIINDDLSNFRDDKGQVIAGYRNPVKNKLIEYGLADCYAHEKQIHPSIWEWSSKSVAALLAGFIATDGSVYKNTDGHIGISFSSSSKEMLIGLKRLLQLKLCVYSSSLTLVGEAGTGNRNNAQWQFTITRFDQVKKLYEFIKDQIPGVKRDRIKSYIETMNYEIRNPDTFFRARRDNNAEEDLGMVQCYDITVEHKDSLFVLANSLIVSNTKHQGGAASSKKVFSGFNVINQFVQTPDIFPDKAVLASKDGQINSILEAPQGGYYVTIDNNPHYIAPGFPVTVKVGDKVESGDILSEGLPDPGEVVELRGLGEGRKYYANRLKEILDDSGMEADRRNTEVLARAALDHVQLTDTDEDSEYLPDDVISYSAFSNNYTPPKDTKRMEASKAIGSYLQNPALHYTIGTRVTPKIAKHLADAGFNEVFTSPTEPKFKSHMIRLRAATHNNTDWLASMHTSYLKKQLSDSAFRGEDTNVESNVHFAPRLAIGENFGENIRQTGKF